MTRRRFMALCLALLLTVPLAAQAAVGDEVSEMYHGNWYYGTVTETGVSFERVTFWELWTGVENNTLFLPATIAGLPLDGYPMDWSRLPNVYNTIVLPDGLETISAFSFYKASAIRRFILPASLTEIGSYAFASTGITTMPLRDSIHTLGSGVFELCENLEEIHLPSGLTEISTSLLSVCTSLKAVTIPAGVTRIGHYAFNYCESLKKLILPEGVTFIGECAFRHCVGLTSMRLPAGVTTLERWLFDGCAALETVTLPQGLKRINAGAFRDCTSLRRLRIPDGVTYIHPFAFNGCEALTLEVTRDSYAHHFAQDNSIPYTLVDSLTGDLNGDGQVGVADAVLLLRQLCGEAIANPTALADLDADGALTLADIIPMLH